MPHKYYTRGKTWLALAVSALIWASPQLSTATSLKLAWHPSSDPNVVGYSLSYGTASGAYNKSLNAGNSTSSTVTSLIPGATYYFVVTAYNSIGLQSLPSNEVSLSLPANVPPSVSLTSPQAGS